MTDGISGSRPGPRLDGPPTIRGMIFDLDGTLVDTRLDFAAMRDEMDLPAGTPILEAMEQMPPGPHREHCQAVLARHEQEGVRRASVMTGALDLAAALARHAMPHAVLTRNTGQAARAVLAATGLSSFNPVLSRDDAPAKPDPAGILKICAEWGLGPDEVIMVGDYRFDLEAGRNAGAAAILYAPNGRPDYADLADSVISSLEELIEWIPAARPPIQMRVRRSASQAKTFDRLLSIRESRFTSAGWRAVTIPSGGRLHDLLESASVRNSDRRRI